MHISTSSLLPPVCFNQSVLYIFLAYKEAISRAQIKFIILSFIIDKPHLKTSYFREFGMSRRLSGYYLETLCSLGYLIRIKKGIYKLSPLSHQLLSDFDAEYTRRLSLPLSWR